MNGISTHGIRRRALLGAALLASILTVVPPALASDTPASDTPHRPLAADQLPAVPAAMSSRGTGDLRRLLEPAGIRICGIESPLSPVGAAMNAIQEVGGRKSTCVGLPKHWLYTVGMRDSLWDVRTAIQDEFLKTKKSFSYSSLFAQTPRAFGFDELLRELHDKLWRDNGGLLPPERKPVIRFMVGEPGDLWRPPERPSDIYADLVKELPTSGFPFWSPDPAKWNVRVAVKRANFGHLYGWNHTKLNIRDGFAAIASSIDTPQHELAIHLGGGATAQWARLWYDTVWLTPAAFLPPRSEFEQPEPPCHGSDHKVCDSIPLPPIISSDPDFNFRSANVFALRRGYVKEGSWGWNFESDKALWEGMKATRNKIFFLSPGMTTGVAPHTNRWSAFFVKHIAHRLADDVDVKFVWGDYKEQPREAAWRDIQDRLMFYLRNDFGLSTEEAQAAFCRFHVAELPISQTQPGSHAKFYMLDGGGFYVGSQNMYPSSIWSDAHAMPELAEFGYYVDAMPGVNMDLAQEAIDRVVIPNWNSALPVKHDFPFGSCEKLFNPVTLEGTTETSPSYTCTIYFDVILDFRNVGYDQVAKAAGSGFCRPEGQTLDIEVRGVIDTNGTFDGRIYGSIGTYTHSTRLTGTFEKNKLQLRFSGLEPSHNISYSGTVETR